MSQTYPYPTTGGPTLPVSSLELGRQAAERYAQVSAARTTAQPRSGRRFMRRTRTATRPA
jgi:hypothetical protein